MQAVAGPGPSGAAATAGAGLGRPLGSWSAQQAPAAEAPQQQLQPPAQQQLQPPPPSATRSTQPPPQQQALQAPQLLPLRGTQPQLPAAVPGCSSSSGDGGSGRAGTALDAIPALSPAEYGQLPAFCRSQISCAQLNEACRRISGMVAARGKVEAGAQVRREGRPSPQARQTLAVRADTSTYGQDLTHSRLMLTASCLMLVVQVHSRQLFGQAI